LFQRGQLVPLHRDAADNLRAKNRREDDALAAQADAASRKLAAAEVGALYSSFIQLTHSA
jgi:hypothetical protein